MTKDGYLKMLKVDLWKIENMQRNYIEACKDFSKDDIILISDVDEIPYKNKIQFLKNCNFDEIAPVGFEQFYFI